MDENATRTGRRDIWMLVAVLAPVQLMVAVFAVYSSEQDILSDGACIGGIFGSLANLAILALVGLIMLVLGIKSVLAKTVHPALAPLLLLAMASALSLMIGVEAMLSCTV